MSDNPRNTQFSGYAKLLLEDLKPELAVLFLALGNKDARDIAWAESFVQATIAQRAYDLVCHAFDGISEGVETLSPEESIATCVTDLTKWSERQEGGNP